MEAHALHKSGNSAIKRIMQEARELAEDPCTDYSAAPREDNVFEWHCTIRGPADTDFEGGLYHFRLTLPPQYPFRPPSIMMLTPNGRFELNTNICISFTNYHEELWQPAWGVRTAIIGLQGLFPLKGQEAVGIGSLELPSAERKRLAKLSREWVCPGCNRSNVENLPDPAAPSARVEVPVNSAAMAAAAEARAKRLQSGAAGIRPSAEMTPRVVLAPATPPAPPSPLTAPMTRPTATTPATPAPRYLAPEAPQAGPAHQATTQDSARPPMFLDTAICVLLVLVFALICKRIF